MTKKLDKVKLGDLLVVIILLVILGTTVTRSCVENNKLEKKEKAEYEIVIKTNTDSAYIAYMKAHTDEIVLNAYRDSAIFAYMKSRSKEIVLNTNRHKDSAYVAYMEENSNKKYIEEIDSIFWKRTLISSDFDYYIKNVPELDINEKHFSAAKDSLIQIEERKWKTDLEAWKRAQEINTSVSYKKYIEKYPNGIGLKQAQKLVIDKEVDDIFGGDYGVLPTMDKTSRGQGKTSNITVYNNTSYTLTLRYSGNERKKIEILSQSRENILLKNGKYRIAASVNAAVRSFAGTETLTGGSYNVEYYITTTRY